MREKYVFRAMNIAMNREKYQTRVCNSVGGLTSKPDAQLYRQGRLKYSAWNVSCSSSCFPCVSKNVIGKHVPGIY